MRVLVCLVVALVMTSVGVARAGSFGGFSADGTRYLERPNRICKPVPKSASNAMPVCTSSTPTAVARAGFRQGSKQIGATATYRTSLAGNNIAVTTRAGKRVLSWTSLDTIDRVVATYLNKSNTIVAIEFEVRSMGRARTEVIGFSLGASTSTTTTTTTTTTTATTTKPIPLPPSVGGPTLTKTQRRQLQRFLRNARQQNKRRRFKAALKWIKKAEALDAEKPEAKYRRAVRLAGLKRDKELIALVTKMGRSGRASGARWWLEVRFNKKVFTRLFVNKSFRVATGLDETVKRVRTTYEIMLGYGGHWEQSGKSCQREQINLRLKRHSNKFRMTIQSRCGNDDWVTKLDGRFAIIEAARTIALTFPNPGHKASVVRIRLGRCKGHPNEPCLKTTIARMKMSLLSVRR